jgi:hypothetical protein
LLLFIYTELDCFVSLLFTGCKYCNFMRRSFNYSLSLTLLTHLFWAMKEINLLDSYLGPNLLGRSNSTGNLLVFFKSMDKEKTEPRVVGVHLRPPRFESSSTQIWIPSSSVKQSYLFP